jgi:drug/metabolite transporter (DMT)-like permease
VGWRNLLGALIFLVNYGCPFWAEQRVPSGIAAVVLAIIPVFITPLEIIFLGTQRLYGGSC